MKQILIFVHFFEQVIICGGKGVITGVCKCDRVMFYGVAWMEQSVQRTFKEGRLIESQWGDIFPAVNTVLESHRVYFNNGTESSPGVKWPERGADHPSSSAGL